MTTPADFDPVSAADVADRLGVSTTVVSNWQARHPDFPAPIFTVGRGRTHVWHWPDVKQYHDRRRKDR